MSGKVKIYSSLLLLIFGLIIFVEYTAQKPIDWTKTYNENDKTPYGTHIFYNELEQLFPESTVYPIKKTVYEFLETHLSDKTDESLDNFIQVDQFANIDAVSAEKLLDFAATGNTVFIASNYFPKNLLDSLQLKTNTNYTFKGEARLKLANKRYSKDSITFSKGLNNMYFSQFKATNTVVLGSQTIKDSSYTNFIKIKHNKGQFLLHLQPIVFTNYSLLKSKKHQAYTQTVLSYLPNHTNLLYKTKYSKNGSLGSSKLRFILSKPALRYAWYLGLLSLLLFLIFTAKRKQRIIKQIITLENSTIAFTKTIGNLYYETKDHSNLIRKKITYFLEYIRRVYYLDTQFLDDKFVKNLASKANKTPSEITILIDTIVSLRAKTNHTEQDLLDLNTLIEDFYNH